MTFPGIFIKRTLLNPHHHPLSIQTQPYFVCEKLRGIKGSLSSWMGVWIQISRCQGKYLTDHSQDQPPASLPTMSLQIYTESNTRMVEQSRDTISQGDCWQMSHSICQHILSALRAPGHRVTKRTCCEKTYTHYKMALLPFCFTHSEHLVPIREVSELYLRHSTSLK